MTEGIAPVPASALAPSPVPAQPQIPIGSIIADFLVRKVMEQQRPQAAQLLHFARRQPYNVPPAQLEKIARLTNRLRQ